jgi:cytochrome c-type biogenesis protein CcmF
MLLGITLVSAIVSVGALFWGRAAGKDGEGITNAGYIATFVTMATLTLSVLVLLVGFFRKDFSLLYVVENHSTDVSSLSWLYKISGIWAGREGSLLFWAWLLSLFASWVAYKRMEFTDELSNMGLAITNIVTTLFTAGMLFSSANNPFKATPADMLGPNGELLTNAAMNPLLQHWAMILHPPTLFIGYAGLTIPFAFAIASLIVNDSSKKWVDIIDRITIFSWLFLGAGIGLGSVWAYVVLGWGGYWGWDPVENASLLPWLTGVGLIHSFTVYKRRDGFKRWAVMMSAFTFALVILGTFITRSGIIDSVHSFAPDPVSLVLFLGMIVGAILAAAIGLWLRWDSFAGNDEFESLTSKEAAYYFNNVIMLVAGVLVAYLTITSALPTWLPFGKQSIPPTTYDAVARPVGILYLLILAVCPLLSWRVTDRETFWKRIKWPLVGGALVFAALVAEYALNLRPIYYRMLALGGEGAAKLVSQGSAGYYQVLAVAGLAVASLLLATTTALFLDGARKRASARGESFGTALWSILTKARTQSGGYLTHIGMGIILIGLVGSTMFVQDQRFAIEDRPGAKFTVNRYTFVYEGTKGRTLANGDKQSNLVFNLSRDGRSLGQLTPGMVEFAAQQKTKLDAAVHSEPLRDVFVVYEGPGNDGKSLSVNVKVNPLISFVWGGFIILLLGTTLAAWPKRVALSEVPKPSLKQAPGKSKSRKR